MQELIYTSAPKGLRLGSRGFCTVASTAGMAKPLADRLEALSGYKHLYPPGSDREGLNPINYSFLTFRLAGKTYYVLSRIADAGLDYTQRTNKLAHHVVFDSSELSVSGPAWLASQPGVLETRWEGKPHIIGAARALPIGELHPTVCRAWQAASGDAGWAGVLAESLDQEKQAEAYIIYRPGTDVLKLVLEAQALLAPSKRWGATFSTYYSKLPPGTECRWRFVPDDTPEALRARRSPELLVIDLVGEPGVAPEDHLVRAARTGIMDAAANQHANINSSNRERRSPQIVREHSAPPAISAESIAASRLPPKLPAYSQTPEFAAKSARAGSKARTWIIGSLIAACFLGVVVGVWFIPSQQKGPIVGDGKPAQTDSEEKIVDSTTAETHNSETPETDTISTESTPATTESPTGSTGNSESDTQREASTTTEEKVKQVSAVADMPPTVDPTYLDGVKDSVALPYRGELSVDGTSIAVLPSKNFPIECTLIGLSPSTAIDIRILENPNDQQRWIIESNNSEIATLTVEPAVAAEQGDRLNLLFRWSPYASQSKQAADELSMAGLSISVPNADISKPCVFNSGRRTTEDTSPITLSQLPNRIKTVNGIISNVPNYQSLVFTFRFDGPGFDKSPISVTCEETNNASQLHPIETRFGPSDEWRVIVSIDRLQANPLSVELDLVKRTSEKYEPIRKAIDDSVFEFENQAKSFLIKALLPFKEAEAKRIAQRQKVDPQPFLDNVNHALHTAGYNKLRKQWDETLVSRAADISDIERQVDAEDPPKLLVDWQNNRNLLQKQLDKIELWKKQKGELGEQFRFHIRIERVLSSASAQQVKDTLLEIGNP